MLIVERIGESKKMCSDMVKCPLCKRGRMCDKPNNIKVKTIVGRLIRNSKETVSVIDLRFSSQHSKAVYLGQTC